MHTTVKFLSALLLCAASATCAASPAAPKNGVEYLTLTQKQPTETARTGKQIEVIEFFAYYCHHCRNYEPVLSSWVAQQGDNIRFKRVHVAHNVNITPQQRLYYTLESMGLTEQYHDKVFAAMHDEKLRLAIDEHVFQWAAGAGIDRARFIEAYRSADTQARVNRANAMYDAYGVRHWPMIAIDGRFTTSPHQSGAGSAQPTEEQEREMSIQVMDFLVAKAKADRK